MLLCFTSLMMEGNPNWWSFVAPSQLPYSSYLSTSSSSSTQPIGFLPESYELSQSWSQLLFGNMPEGDGGFLSTNIHKNSLPRKFEQRVDDQIYDPSLMFAVASDVKQEDTHFKALAKEDYLPGNILSSHLYGVSFPNSCTIGSSKSMLHLENSTRIERKYRHSNESSECNDTASHSVCKKIKVEPHMKVRKEKLGDRITALHQLVSPFGKTDTASVLLEAIGYIRILQGQIQALSTSYVGTMINQQSIQRELSSTYLEEAGGILNDICKKKKRAQSQENQDMSKDLRSRGLCLVPLNCAQTVGDDCWSAGANRGL